MPKFIVIIIGLLVLGLRLGKSDLICCPWVGCYEKGFFSILIPFCYTVFDSSYTLYTRLNQQDGQNISITNIPTVFDATHTTVIIVHGYLSSANNTWMRPLKDEFLIKDDLNVILIDWGQGSKQLSYDEAAGNTREVGRRMADLIQSIISTTQASSSNMWCVGHSLGAHICGFTGEDLLTETQLGRITGMDPAGPLFDDGQGVTVGLNSSCAKFVDIIHTDQGVYGTTKVRGHLDFYPDGYRYSAQTGSSGTSIEICDDVCSHSKSIEFMKISINNNCFIANQHCTSNQLLPAPCTTYPGCLAYMGYEANNSCNKTGIVYIKVNKTAPYCLSL